MPYITVEMLEGHTDEQQRALLEKVTDAVVESTYEETMMYMLNL